jgi:hypothetical protein
MKQFTTTVEFLLNHVENVFEFMQSLNPVPQSITISRIIRDKIIVVSGNYGRGSSYREATKLKGSRAYHFPFNKLTTHQPVRVNLPNLFQNKPSVDTGPDHSCPKSLQPIKGRERALECANLTGVSNGYLQNRPGLIYNIYHPPTPRQHIHRR